MINRENFGQAAPQPIDDTIVSKNDLTNGGISKLGDNMSGFGELGKPFNDA